MQQALLLSLLLCAGAHSTGAVRVVRDPLSSIGVRSSVRTPQETCQRCLDAVQMVEDAVWAPSATDSVVKFLLDNVCPWLPLSTKCDNLAEGLVPVFIHWLRSCATPNALCSSLDGCTAPDLTPRMSSSAALRGDASGCAMCAYVVTTAKDALDINHGSVEAAVAQAKQACVELPTDLVKACASMVDTYGPAITFLLADMEADQLCQLAGVCSAASQLGGVHHKPASLPAAAVSLLAATRRVAVVSAAPRQAPLKDESCDVCKMAVMEARTLATDPVTQASLTNYTLTLCDQFPTVADQCKLYVNAYAPLVFSLLDVYLVPEVLCAEIGVCPPPPAPPLLPLQQRLQQQQPAKYQQLMRLAARSAEAVAGASRVQV